MRNKIMIASCYGVRENEANEQDFRDYINNGQNVMFLTMVHDDGDSDAIFYKNLKICEKYGIDCIIYDSKINSCGLDITEQYVIDATRTYRDSSSFYGIGFPDEPGSPDFARLGAIVTACKQVYPEKATVLNLLPMYAAQFVFGYEDYNDYLESFVKQVDVDHISVDVYPFTVDEDGNEYTYDEYLRAFNIQSQICKKYNRDFWMYIQSMEFLPNREPQLEEFRFQIYSALSFGAVCILHFCYDLPGGSIRQDRSKKPVWTYSRTVNCELLAISPIYMQYKNLGAFVHGVGLIPQYVDFENQYENFNYISNIISTETLLIGCFEKKESSGYAFTLVNMSELSEEKIANVEFRLKDAMKVTAYIKGIPTVLKEVDGLYFTALDCGEGIFVTVDTRL